MNINLTSKSILIVLTSLSISVLAPLGLNAQVSVGPLRFILPGVQAKDDNRAWHVVDSNFTCVIKGKQFSYKKLGGRYILSLSDAGDKFEARMSIEDGVRYVSVIHPIKQDNIRITITNVHNGVLKGDQVPRKMWIDSNGRTHIDILIQDVTLIKAKTFDDEIPVFVDSDSKASIWWIREKTINVGKTIRNTTELYFDEYENIYNDKNCFNIKEGSGPIFKEVIRNKPTRYFYLIQESGDVVVNKYLDYSPKK